MSNIIAVASQKGGVGKTTLSTGIASCLRRNGKKVLFLDCDPQCNSTDTYRALIEGQTTLYDVMVDKVPIQEAIQVTEMGEIIACDPLLKTADSKLVDMGKEYRMKEALDQIADDYDYIILDTPPQLGIMLTNALTAVHSVIIPITPDRYSLQGLDQLVESIKLCKKYSNNSLVIEGIVLNKYAPREILTQSTISNLPEIAAKMNSKVFQTVIRESASARKAQAVRLGIFEYEPYCSTARDIENLTKEIMEG